MPKIELSSNEESNNYLIKCYNCNSLINDIRLKYCENCHAIINPNDLKWRNSFIICLCLLCVIPFLIALTSFILKG